MAGNNSSQQKTEAPTPRKIREARKKGQVPKSRDFSAAVILLSALALIAFIKDSIISSMQNLLVEYFSNSLTMDLPAENLPNYLFGFLVQMSLILLPVFIIIVIAAVAANIIQTGIMFAPQVLQPKLERLNPIEGFKRIFSRRSLFELVKNLLKIIIVATAAFFIVKGRLSEMLLMYFKTPAQLLVLIADTMLVTAFAGVGHSLLSPCLTYCFKNTSTLRTCACPSRKLKTNLNKLKETQW